MKSYITDNNNKAILSEQMKIIELIDADYRLLSIIMRLDITLPFGDISVEQMCRRYDMSPTLFLMICRVYSDEDYTPDIEGLNIGNMLHLIRFLRASHRYYLDHMIPRITQGMQRVLGACERRQSDILRRFYEDYVAEVEAHLAYEETTIFPYVEALAAGRADGTMHMRSFMANHTDICDKIDDMKSVVIKYLPESCPTQQRCELMFDIFRMKEDLGKHTRLESTLLAPVATNAEEAAES